MFVFLQALDSPFFKLLIQSPTAPEQPATSQRFRASLSSSENLVNTFLRVVWRTVEVGWSSQLKQRWP